MRNVYIATLGFDPYPSFGMLACGESDKIYLLNDRREEEAKKSERIIRDILDGMKWISYEIREVDCYDYYDVYDKIIDIVEEERAKGDCKIHINFSRGTAIAVGAACNAACTIDDVDLFYVKWKSGGSADNSKKIIHVDVSEFSALEKMKESTKEVFKCFSFADSGTMSNNKLVELSGLEINSVTYHTKRMVKLGLIMKSVEGRNTDWYLTNTGKRVLKKILKEHDSNNGN